MFHAAEAAPMLGSAWDLRRKRKLLAGAFEPSSNGVASRVMVCYRDPTIDPVSDPNLKTSLWRDPPVSGPKQA